MRDNGRDSKMNTATQKAVGPDARVPRAIEVLLSLDTSDVTRVMIARLARRRDLERGLPPCQRDEDPVAIFVDVIRWTRDAILADKLRFACLQALRSVNFEITPSPDVLGDLCYLAAALAADEALDVLPSIVAADRSEKMLLLDGEAVRSRALRAVVGLLAISPRRDASLEKLFENLLLEPRYQILALTGLIGLWPDRRREFIAMAPAGQVDERLLNANLDLVGFGSSATTAAH
jgi:hypothetical protein